MNEITMEMAKETISLSFSSSKKSVHGDWRDEDSNLNKYSIMVEQSIYLYTIVVYKVHVFGIDNTFLGIKTYRGINLERVIDSALTKIVQESNKDQDESLLDSIKIALGKKGD